MTKARSKQSNQLSRLTENRVRRLESEDGTIRWTFGHLTRCDRGLALSAPPMFLGSTVVAAFVFGIMNPFTLVWGLASIAMSIVVIPWTVGGDMVRVIELPSRSYWFEFRVFGLLALRGRRSLIEEESLMIDWKTVNERSKRMLTIEAGAKTRWLFDVFPEELGAVRFVERRLKRDFKATGTSS